ncbi:MAG: universal stress protein [Anaerolineales bacterium]|nr:universal stress protein [Anaerolineales bacterium]
MNGWNVSGVVQKVIDRARKSILLARAFQPFAAPPEEISNVFRFRRILVPLDGSQRAESVLPTVTALAQYYDAEVVLVHIVAKPESIQRMPLAARDAAFLDQVVERNRAQAIQYFAELQPRLPMVSHLQIEVGASVAAKLHEVVEQANADLVVLSAHGHSCQRQWSYGSVTISFIAYGTTPLLILQDLPSHEIALSKAEQMSEVTQPWSPSWRDRTDTESMAANAV